MLLYDPQYVLSSTLRILRRTNCITTASGIATLCKKPYSMQVESRLQSALHLHTVRLSEAESTSGHMVLSGETALKSIGGFVH